MTPRLWTPEIVRPPMPVVDGALRRIRREERERWRHIRDPRVDRQIPLQAGIIIDITNLGVGFADPGSTTIALTTTSAVASGGFIIVSVGWFNIVSLSSVAGGGLTWTVDKQGQDGVNGPASCSAGIASAQAPSGLASGTTITATFSGSAVARNISASSFTGIKTTTPAEASDGPKGSGGSATTAWATNSVALSGGSLLFATSYNETSDVSNTVTAPSLQAVIVHNTASGLSSVSCYRIESSAGNYSVAGTWGGSVKSTTVAVAYLAAAGGGGGSQVPYQSYYQSIVTQ